MPDWKSVLQGENATKSPRDSNPAATVAPLPEGKVKNLQPFAFLPLLSRRGWRLRRGRSTGDVVLNLYQPGYLAV